MLKIDTHKVYLIKILKEIYNDTSLGPLLGFKGGTALYLFYNLPRFSVDLDLDLLDETKKDWVFKKVEKILEKFGQIKDKQDKLNTLFFLLVYEKGQRNIKIEISKRNLGSGYELKNYLGISVLVMKEGDLAANKFLALLDRKKPANRDIFDIWFFLDRNLEIDWKIIEKKSGLKAQEYLRKCIGYLEKLPSKNILSGMGELLDLKTRNWAKENLLKETIFFLKLHLKEGK